MNPIKNHAATRTKANIKDMRTLYLDLDRNGDDFLQAIRSSGEVPPPNFVLNKYTIEPEVYISWPDPDAKIIQIIDFFEGNNKAVEYAPGDERQLEEETRHARNDPGQVKLPKSAYLEDAYFLAFSAVKTVSVGERHFLAEELPYEQLEGQIQLNFKDTPNGDIHTFSHYGGWLQNVETYEIDEANLAGDWLERESGIYGRISKTTDGKAILFPNLKAARSEIEAQTLAGAARILQDKLDSTKREIHFLGLSVEERIAVWAGPTTLLFSYSTSLRISRIWIGAALVRMKVSKTARGLSYSLAS